MSITESLVAAPPSLFNRDKLFIGGEWVEPASTNRIELINPATEEVIGSVPEATVEDVDRAAAIAVDTWENSAWRRLSFVERAEYLVRIADELEKRAEYVEEANVRDFGGIRSSSRLLTQRSALQLRLHMEYAKQLPSEPERVEIGGVEALLVREPVGPVLGIVAWNGTLTMSILKLAPALLAGCPVVVKVPVESALLSFVFADAIEAAGLPKGLVSFLPGRRESLGEITRRPEFRHISFTGSTPSGIKVMKDAAENLAGVTLELGGKSPGIILDDLNPETDASRVLNGTMTGSGQICTTYSRLFVPRSRETEWRTALAKFYDGLIVGDPSNPDTQIGPLATAEHRDRVEGYIQSARDEGATIIAGGGRPADQARGFFLRPTLIADVTPDMKVVKEEIFGPVITLQAYDTEEQVIKMANDTEYGLAAGIFTDDQERGLRIAHQLEAGNVSLNLWGGSLLLPFGGYKKSGIGREGGIEGVEELLEWKQIQLKRS